MKLRRTVYLVHPAHHRIVKMFPNNPPVKGDIVLVKDFDGLDRCRVVRTPLYDWEGLTWTLRGPIKVVPA